MGYIRHHAIIVTTWKKELADEAHVEACRLFGKCLEYAAAIAPVSGILHSTVNDDYTFLVAPDGSKEGWAHSAAGDEARAQFIAWLNEQRYEDGSSPYAWVEVQYGDERGETVVVSHSDEAQYNQGVPLPSGYQAP